MEGEQQQPPRAATTTPPPADDSGIDRITRGLGKNRPGPQPTPAVNPAASDESGPAAKPPQGRAADPAEVVSRADVDQMIRDAVANAVKNEGDKYARERADGFAREQFIRKNMDDLPGYMARLMPDTGDAKKLAAAEQDLRAEYRDHLTALAKAGKIKFATIGTVDSDTPDGVRTFGPGALSNDQRSPTDKIAAGLHKQRMNGGGDVQQAGLR